MDVAVALTEPTLRKGPTAERTSSCHFKSAALGSASAVGAGTTVASFRVDVPGDINIVSGSSEDLGTVSLANAVAEKLNSTGLPMVEFPEPCCPDNGEGCPKVLPKLPAFPVALKVVEVGLNPLDGFAVNVSPNPFPFPLKIIFPYDP